MALCVAAAGLSGCQRPPSPSGSAGTASPGQGPALPTADVVFHPSAGGAPIKVHVELARTVPEQSKGLMFRRSLDADSGMLFIFERPEIRRFWMRNTYIPLDMIFLDGERRVVGIEENTVPLDESSRGPDQPAQYVVEVQGGYARRHGIGLGSRADFQGVN